MLSNFSNIQSDTEYLDEYPAEYRNTGIRNLLGWISGRIQDTEKSALEIG